MQVVWPKREAQVLYKLDDWVGIQVSFKLPGSYPLLLPTVAFL